VDDFLEKLRTSFGNLNERERKLVVVLGIIVVVLVIGLPFYFLTSSISDIETENHEIANVLRDISRNRAKLAASQQEREMRMQRYRRPPPALRNLVAERGEAVGLPIRETVPQPDIVVGNFTRRHLRVVLPGVGLRPVVELMANLDNIREYPIAIKRLQVEHFRGGDRYNVQLDVVAYEQTRREGEAAGGEPTADGERRRPRGAGPPGPE
jgi:hypothetical protein